MTADSSKPASPREGPLTGVKVVELGGIGPGPLGVMMLSDMGADVIQLDRVRSDFKVGGDVDPRFAVYNRGRKSVLLDLTSEEGRAIALKLIADADVVVEGFRPGVAEKLRLGPDDCLAGNPGLIYARMTGWGQDGPLAQAPGHDINYIALTGALHAIGKRDGPPIPPLNMVGDVGGGGLMMAFGVVCALVERERSGKGQVVDASIVDGAALMMTFSYAALAAGRWTGERESGMVDGGMPWYGVYKTRDGKYVSIGALEPKFYHNLLRLTGLADAPDLPDRADRDRWPELRERFEKLFSSRTRDEWCALLEGTDTCFAPVLDLPEAIAHPHLALRRTYTEIAGASHPSPAPRFSRSRPEIAGVPPEPGEHTDKVLREFGYSASEIRVLRDKGIVGWENFRPRGPGARS